MKDKIVCIEWEDASFNNGYYDEDKPSDFDPILNFTVGHVIKSNKKVIITSTDKWGGKDKVYRHTSTIPRKMIKSITVLVDKKEQVC